MNWLRNFLLYCVVFLTLKLKSSLSFPLIRRPSDHCSHGLCPVIPKQSKLDPTTFYCPPRYRLNLDICLPTKKLCEDAHKHGLYCTTSNPIRKLHEEWIEFKNLIQMTNQWKSCDIHPSLHHNPIRRHNTTDQHHNNILKSNISKKRRNWFRFPAIYCNYMIVYKRLMTRYLRGLGLYFILLFVCVLNTLCFDAHFFLLRLPL